MKLKDGIVLSQMGDEYVAVATGEASKNFNGMIRINPTAALLMEHLQKETTVDSLVKVLLDNYEVDEATAKRDVETVVESFRRVNLLNE